MPTRSVLFSHNAARSASETGQRVVLSIRPPPGWQIPQVSAPEGALRLTVGGQSPDGAPASMMIRALSAGEPFEAFCEREIASLRASFADASESDATTVDQAERRWCAKRITGRLLGSRALALLTLVDAGDHFLWFGLLVRDRSQWDRAPAAYQLLMQSFQERPFEELMESVNANATVS